MSCTVYRSTEMKQLHNIKRFGIVMQIERHDNIHSCQPLSMIFKDRRTQFGLQDIHSFCRTPVRGSKVNTV